MPRLLYLLTVNLHNNSLLKKYGVHLLYLFMLVLDADLNLIYISLLNV